MDSWTVGQLESLSEPHGAVVTGPVGGGAGGILRLDGGAEGVGPPLKEEEAPSSPPHYPRPHARGRPAILHRFHHAGGRPARRRHLRCGT
eukprot:1061531-Prorocentrum_minimum.AAC.1